MKKEAIYKAIQSFGESKVIGVEINKSVYEVPRPLKVLSKILCIPYIIICFIVFFRERLFQLLHLTLFAV